MLRRIRQLSRVKAKLYPAHRAHSILDAIKRRNRTLLKTRLTETPGVANHTIINDSESLWPISYAIQNNDIESIELLLDHGASTHARKYVEPKHPTLYNNNRQMIDNVKEQIANCSDKKTKELLTERHLKEQDVLDLSFEVQRSVNSEDLVTIKNILCNPNLYNQLKNIPVTDAFSMVTTQSTNMFDHALRYRVEGIPSFLTFEEYVNEQCAYLSLDAREYLESTYTRNP